jgi:hypothetical protein
MKGEGKLREKQRETDDDGNSCQVQMLIISSHDTPRCVK